MIPREANESDVRWVMHQLAPDRVAELTATAWHDSALQIGVELEAIRKMHPTTKVFALAGDNGLQPIAIVGVLPFGPAFGGMVWAATSEWPPYALSSHRWWHRWFVPIVLKNNYRRVEFTALAADQASRDWLKSLGFTEEGIAYRQGKRGEDFVHMAWLNPDPTVGVAHV